MALNVSRLEHWSEVHNLTQRGHENSWGGDTSRLRCLRVCCYWLGREGSQVGGGHCLAQNSLFLCACFSYLISSYRNGYLKETVLTS